MPAETLYSHEGTATPAPAPAQRLRTFTRTIEESFGGWPQAWSIYQNVPTPFGYPISAAPFARGASGTPTDRQFGRDVPLYYNEIDLRGFRVLSKFLTDTNQFGKGFLRRLVDYHVRKGFGWQACRYGVKKTPYPTEAASDPVVERGQQCLDRFRDLTQWPMRSREAYERLEKYGEVAGRFGIYERRPWFRFIGSDQIGNPTGDTHSPQSFGIETAEHDIEDRWAFHVWDVADYPTGGEWIDAGEIVFVKVNVESDVKRGLPSFFPVQDALDSVRRLLSNMLGSAIKKARVAWREKFPLASARQVQELIPTSANPGGQNPSADYPYGYSGYYPGWYGGVNGFEQGDVIKVEGSREFEEGPGDTAAFIEAEQAALRGAAVCFGFPESIATGKIDDVNFAAALTTGAPFVVAIEGRQFQFGCQWERESALKALDLGVRLGWLSPEDRRQLDVEVTEPSPLVTEPDKETQRRKTMFDAKVLSGQTWQLMEQLDPQHEAANAKAWEALHPQPMGPDGKAGDSKSDTVSDLTGPAQESTDSSGHEHKGSGKGGGQFTSGGGSSGKSDPHDYHDPAKAAAVYGRVGQAATKHSEVNNLMRAIAAMTPDQARAAAAEMGFKFDGQDPRSKLIEYIYERRGAAIRSRMTSRPESSQGKRDAAESKAMADEPLLKPTDFVLPVYKATEAKDSSGHDHKGKGKGGGQFAAGDDGGSAGGSALLTAFANPPTDRAKEHIHSALFNAGYDPDHPPKTWTPDRKSLARSVAREYRDLSAAGGTPEELASLEQVALAHGMKPVEAAGETIPFDGTYHESDTPLRTGEMVKVVRPGWTLPEPARGEGAEYLVLHARVMPVKTEAA